MPSPVPGHTLLYLVEGRLSMLMKAELQESDHPVATGYVLNCVREALERELPADGDKMMQISELIADLQTIQERFGNTCVYVRRHGLSWGAVALNYRDDDKKNGTFDLHAEYDRRLVAHAEQVERLKSDRDRWMEKACALEAAQ